MSSIRDAKDYLTSEDMKLLEEVHTRICAQRFLLKDSLASIRIAVRLIKLFQQGETDPQQLYGMFQRETTLRPSKARLATARARPPYVA